MLKPVSKHSKEKTLSEIMYKNIPEQLRIRYLLEFYLNYHAQIILHKNIHCGSCYLIWILAKHIASNLYMQLYEIFRLFLSKHVEIY